MRHTQHLVRRRRWNRYSGAVGPAHLDVIDVTHTTQSKMRHCFHLAEIAAAGINGAQLSPATSIQNHNCAACRCASAGQRHHPQPGVIVWHGAVQTEWLEIGLAVTHQQFESTITIEVSDRSAGAQTSRFERITRIDLRPSPVPSSKQTVRFADIIEKDFQLAIVIEVGGNHRSDPRWLSQVWWRNIDEQTIPLLQKQAMRAFPVAIHQIEPTIVIEVAGSDPAPMFVRIGQTGAAGDLFERTIAAVGKEKVGTVLVHRENVHPQRHQRQRNHAASTGCETDACCARHVLDFTEAIQFVQAERTAIIRNKEAIAPGAKPINDRDRTTGGEIERLLVLRQFEQIDPTGFLIVEQPITKALAPGKRIGIEHINLFPTVAVNIASSNSDRLTLRIGEDVVSNIDESDAIPAEHPVGAIEPGDEQFTHAIVIDIDDGNAVVQSRWIVTDQMTIIDKHGHFPRSPGDLHPPPGIIILNPCHDSTNRAFTAIADEQLMSIPFHPDQLTVKRSDMSQNLFSRTWIDGLIVPPLDNQRRCGDARQKPSCRALHKGQLMHCLQRHPHHATQLFTNERIIKVGIRYTVAQQSTQLLIPEISAGERIVPRNDVSGDTAQIDQQLTMQPERWRQYCQACNRQMRRQDEREQTAHRESHNHNIVTTPTQCCEPVGSRFCPLLPLNASQSIGERSVTRKQWCINAVTIVDQCGSQWQHFGGITTKTVDQQDAGRAGKDGKRTAAGIERRQRRRRLQRMVHPPTFRV
jgi:hypothetical protein